MAKLEDMVHMETDINFYEKLSHVQNELKAPKGQYNKFGGYSYRSCEDIMEAVKPLLSKYGLVQFVGDEINLIGDRYYVKATVTVTDGKTSHSVSAYAREEQSKKGMDSAQLTGATSSYARKYALNGMYNIDDTKDADTNEMKRQVDNSNFNRNTQQQKPITKAQTNPDNSLAKFTDYILSVNNEEDLKIAFTKIWKMLSSRKDLQQKAKAAYDARLADLTIK